MNRFSCNWIDKGLFVSHNGVGMCCEQSIKPHILPTEFWLGQQRKQAQTSVKNNLQVKGCDICYNKEKLKTPSSRIFSKKYSTIPIKRNPAILDLDLSNLCNLKCVMCNSQRSSQWAGSVNEVSNDVIEDLIKISDEVKILTIQGGEPTVMEQYKHYFELLKEKGFIKNIHLQIITNATNTNEKFYNLINEFKSVQLSVSVDAYGKANDYIRWPSKFDSIERNIKNMTDLNNNVRVEILNSINMLSMFNYNLFLEWCKDLQNYYESKNRYFGLVPMKVITPVRFSPFSAPKKLKENFSKQITDFFTRDSLTHNPNSKTDLQILVKSIVTSPENKDAISQLLTSIEYFDNDRGSDIRDYIPNFFDHIKKSQ